MQLLKSSMHFLVPHGDSFSMLQLFKKFLSSNLGTAPSELPGDVFDYPYANFISSTYRRFFKQVNTHQAELFLLV